MQLRRGCRRAYSLLVTAVEALGNSQLDPYDGHMEAEIGARVREQLKALSPPVTQAQMASRLGLTPDAFSRSLSGKRSFTAVELVNLAEELGTSAHWFVTGEPDPYAVKFAGRHIYDPLVKDYVKVDWAETRQARDDVALAYIQAYGEEPTLPAIARPKSAAEARIKLFEVGGEGFVRRLADNVELAFGIDVIRLERIEPDFALSVLGRDVIVLDASAYWFRENFSIAHELAHILLGHLDTLGEQACSDKEAERSANTFAADLLTPASEMRKVSWATASSRDVAEFVWEAGVSTAAARTRVKALRLSVGAEGVAALAEKTQVLLQQQLPNLADEVTVRMQEAGRRRFPQHLVTAHSRAVATGRIRADTLAWMLGEPVDLIRDELAPSRPPADLDWLASELGLND